MTTVLRTCCHHKGPARPECLAAPSHKQRCEETWSSCWRSDHRLTREHKSINHQFLRPGPDQTTCTHTVWTRTCAGSDSLLLHIYDRKAWGHILINNWLVHCIKIWTWFISSSSSGGLDVHHGFLSVQMRSWWCHDDVRADQQCLINVAGSSDDIITSPGSI